MKKSILASVALCALFALHSFALPRPVAASFARGAQFEVTGYDAAKSTLADFPVLVRIANDSPSGFAYSQLLSPSDGADICFIDMEGNGLPFEIDTWDPDGTSLVWVKLPTMAQGTQFVMCWGSATTGKTVCGDNPFAGYKGVWHMNSTSPADASGSGNDGTAAGSAAIGAGKIGSALSLPNKSDYVTCGQNQSNAELKDGFTVEAWVNAANLSGNHCIFGKNLFISFRTSGNNQIQVTTPGKKDHNMNATVPAAGTWWHVVLTFQKKTGNGCKVYVNGALAVQTGADDIQDQSNATEMWLGRNQWGNDQNFQGLLDEIRLSVGLKSADWIAATYATQSDPAFLTVGAAQAYEASAAPAVGLVAPSAAVFYTNATLTATVGSLGMDDLMTTDASWVDPILVVSKNADLSSPVHSVSLGRVSAAPASVPAPVSPLALTTTYYARVFATNSFGVAGESSVMSFTTPVPGPVFTASVNTDHIAPDISLAFTSPGLGDAVTGITVDVSTSDDFGNPALTKTFPVNLAAMPTNVTDLVLTGLPVASPLHYRFTAVNADGYAKSVVAEAANPIGNGNNVWSGLSEDIGDPAAYVFAGGLPAPGKTLYFTKPAGRSPVINTDTAMPMLRFTNGQGESVETTYQGGYHSCGYDLSGSGVLTFTAEKPILQASKGTNVVRNPLVFNRSNSQTVYVTGLGGRLDLTGELMLPDNVSNTTMRVNGEGGEVHFGGPSADFMGRLFLESSFTLSLDHPNAMTNVNRIYFEGGWGSFTYLKNNTGAPMTFPRCTMVDNTTGWSNTRACYDGAPFLFPAATARHYDRGGNGTREADVFVKNLVVLNAGTWFNKYGNGTFSVAEETTWESIDAKHGIVLYRGCFYPQTAAGLPPSGEFYIPNDHAWRSTLGLGSDFNPTLDGSSTPRFFQSSKWACWGFTGFGGERTVCWNADPTLNLTNTTGGTVEIKLADSESTNVDGKTYDTYYAYPPYFMFGNRSEFADGTILFMNPIRYEFGQGWDATTRFESTNHVVAARLRGSLKLGSANKTWNFSGNSFGGYLALEADNGDFTGKVNVYEKGNLLVNSNLVARSVTVQSGAGLGGTDALSTVDGTTVKSGGTLFGGEWNKGGKLTLGGKVTLENGAALRAEVGASNDRIGFVKLAPGSTFKHGSTIYVDVATDPKVSPVSGVSCKIIDWSETTFDSGAVPTRANFVTRPEINTDLKKLSVFVRDDGLYMNYVTIRCPRATCLIMQ